MGRMTLRSKLEMGRRLFGELDCTVVAPTAGPAPDFAVVLCHGFGAPGTDLVGLAPELAELMPQAAGSIAYVFPEGPIDMGGYGFPGRAWWMVDVERFQRAAGNPRDMAAISAEVPDGMPEASQLLRGCLQAAERELGVPMSRTLLGGFSQGSMVATDVTLRLPTSPAGLCVFSGHLLAENEWRPLAKKRGPLPVLQTHGRLDPILPFAGAEALRDMLTAAGMTVEFVAFNGPHTISLEGLERCAALIGRLAGAGR